MKSEDEKHKRTRNAWRPYTNSLIFFYIIYIDNKVVG